MSIFNEKINTWKFSTDKKYKDTALNYYNVAGNGYFKERTSGIVTITSKVDKIPNLPELQEGVTVHVDPIPFEIFNKIRLFFKNVYKDDKTESSAFVLQDNKTKKYEIFIPEQKNSGATSNYEMGSSERFNNEIKSGKTLILVAHSHPWKSSSTSPSGTDNGDEKEPILYMILSNVEEVPVYYLSTCDGDRRIKIDDFFAVWENPLMKSYHMLDDKAKNLISKSIKTSDILEAFIEDVEIPYEEWRKYIKKDIFESRVTNAFKSGSYMLNQEDYFHNSNYYHDYTHSLNSAPYGKITTFFPSNGLKKNETRNETKSVNLDDIYEYVYRNIEDRYREDLESGKLTIPQVKDHYERLKFLEESSEEDKIKDSIIDDIRRMEKEESYFEHDEDDETAAEKVIEFFINKSNNIDKISNPQQSIEAKKQFLEEFREDKIPNISLASVMRFCNLSTKCHINYDKLSDKIIETLYDEKIKTLEDFTGAYIDLDEIFEFSPLEQIVFLCTNSAIERIKTKYPKEYCEMQTVLNYVENEVGLPLCLEKAEECLCEYNIDDIIEKECI